MQHKIIQASMPLPNSIIFQPNSCWIKQNSAIKIRQQWRRVINLLTEIKLKEKEGTQRTLVRIKVALILTVLMWVTSAKLPFDNLTFLETIDVIVVRNDSEKTIWSVVPGQLSKDNWLNFEWPFEKDDQRRKHNAYLLKQRFVNKMKDEYYLPYHRIDDLDYHR
jgi:hypothetical protein